MTIIFKVLISRQCGGMLTGSVSLGNIRLELTIPQPDGGVPSQSRQQFQHPAPSGSAESPPVESVLMSWRLGGGTVLRRCCDGAATVLRRRCERVVPLGIPCTSLIYPLYIPCTRIARISQTRRGNGPALRHFLFGFLPLRSPLLDWQAG